MRRKGNDKILKIQTEAMMIRRPAPDDPPITETIRLGVMAIDLVTKFLIHFFILRSKKPYRMLFKKTKYPISVNYSLPSQEWRLVIL